MKLIADMHTHTIASHLAYSTVLENAAQARKNGLEAFACTDHALGPHFPDAPIDWHFTCMDMLPDSIEGVWLFRGIETNVSGLEGGLDTAEDVLKKMEWVIASIHDRAIRKGSMEDRDRMWQRIAENPLVDVIGHSGRAGYEYHPEKVAPLFKEAGKFVEINSHSLDMGSDTVGNCREIALCCKKYGAPVVVNTDSHFCAGIGRADKALQMLEELDFPAGLVLNADADWFYEHMAKRTGRSFGR